MVLASAGPDISLEELSQMANKIVEVATPSASAIKFLPQLNTNIEYLYSEVVSLTDVVKLLTTPPY